MSEVFRLCSSGLLPLPDEVPSPPRNMASSIPVKRELPRSRVEALPAGSVLRSTFTIFVLGGDGGDCLRVKDRLRLGSGYLAIDAVFAQLRLIAMQLGHLPENGDGIAARKQAVVADLHLHRSARLSLQAWQAKPQEEVDGVDAHHIHPTAQLYHLLDGGSRAWTFQKRSQQIVGCRLIVADVASQVTNAQVIALHLRVEWYRRLRSVRSVVDDPVANAEHELGHGSWAPVASGFCRRIARALREVRIRIRVQRHSCQKLRKPGTVRPIVQLHVEEVDADRRHTSLTGTSKWICIRSAMN
eukprot:scaffold407_cov251-Pinguiococcus_pyrenoidosus.AAC.17